PPTGSVKTLTNANMSRSESSNKDNGLW
ncbi:uncharacterized protein METZ01_LOCUS511402, partial [marine metagenome]